MIISLLQSYKYISLRSDNERLSGNSEVTQCEIVRLLRLA